MHFFNKVVIEVQGFNFQPANTGASFVLMNYLSSNKDQCFLQVGFVKVAGGISYMRGWS